MTVLELLNEYMPRELAAIVTGYAIRDDWRSVKDNMIARMKERVRIPMVDYNRVFRWFFIAMEWGFPRVRSLIEVGMVKGFVHFINSPTIDLSDHYGERYLETYKFSVDNLTEGANKFIAEARNKREHNISLCRLQPPILFPIVAPTVEGLIAEISAIETRPAHPNFPIVASSASKIMRQLRMNVLE